MYGIFLPILQLLGQFCSPREFTVDLDTRMYRYVLIGMFQKEM